MEGLAAGGHDRHLWSMTTIYTICYEGATVDGFLATLKQAGVERLIDVRALPSSRRPGFSKSPLAAALSEVGIEYVHLRPNVPACCFATSAILATAIVRCCSRRWGRI